MVLKDKDLVDFVSVLNRLVGFVRQVNCKHVQILRDDDLAQSIGKFIWCRET